FHAALAEVIGEQRIDAIFPAMDAVAETLQHLAPALGIPVIGSDAETTAVCASKRATYSRLAGRIPVPKSYSTVEEVDRFPVFLKPDRGYGSRNCTRADSKAELVSSLQRESGGDRLVLEFLPGKEWTIDCFS